MRIETILVASVAMSILLPGSAVEAGERILRTEVTVPAPIEDVWAAWTTDPGVQTFFARGSHIEPRVDGLYEIHFEPSAPAGSRGADGMRILVFEPPNRLVFTWNAPPSQREIRRQRTVVAIRLRAEDAKRTRLTFSHSGWGEGPAWNAAYDYFDDAWNGFVLPSLVRRFEKGPLDWSSHPELKPVAPTLKMELTPDPAALR